MVEREKYPFENLSKAGVVGDSRDSVGSVVQDVLNLGRSVHDVNPKTFQKKGKGITGGLHDPTPGS